ncbi:MAG: flagellar protein FliS [Pirellulales bacterium]|nr:flagellar protein FliS [Pirellulales bacterium]
MQSNAHEEYLSARIMTATPQKLHLILIERAVHQLQFAVEIWDTEDRIADRDTAIGRCIEIMGELLIGIRDSSEPIARQVADVYAFLFRTITEAKFLNDITKLHDALRVLSIERETWRKVCEKFGDRHASHEPYSTSGQGSMELDPFPPDAAPSLRMVSEYPTASGLSLEA